MIPYLYGSTETEFNGKCICRLAESTYCIVTEERNGIYECEFKYPISGKYFGEIQIGRFIGCTHDDQRDVQPFRIYKSSAPIDGMVTFYAHHLSYKLSRIILNPFTASSVTQAISKLSTESINANPFTFWTNKTTSGNLESKVPTSVRSILGGTEGSILDTYGGGEYKFDRWEVRLYSNELPISRGSDTGVTIRYGKNLRDINHDVDAENIYNAIIPYWKGRSETVKEFSESSTYAVGDLVRYNGTVYKCTTAISTAGTWDTGHWTTAEATDYTYTFSGEDMEIVVLLSEKIVAQSGVTNPQAIPVDFSSDFQTQPTQAQLRQRAQAYLASNDTWTPKENIKIDFVQLWQTDEYKDVAALQRVNLCDVVNVFHPKLGVMANGVKVIKTVYNVLLDRYDNMELGKTKTNFMENIEANYDKQIAQVSKGFEAILRAEIDYATELLTNPGNSHVVFVGIDEDGNRVYGKGAINNPQEILVMNTTNPATATQVLRINKNGIGFADNVNGPYRSAWTLDGHFVADYITAGTINGNLIRTGMLSDYSSTTFVLTSDTSIVAGKQYYIRKLVPSYSSDSLYSVGDLARYNGTVYKCTNAINETESWTSSHWTTAGSSDYTYVMVNTPMPVELGSYYEIQNTSQNYWNLETGEFRLSSTATLGGKTAQQIIDDATFVPTQQNIFNALTNNGQTQGIYLQNGLLYINASYIATGILADVNNNTTFNLSTGDLTMTRGSISIGSRFSVDPNGYMTCSDADIEGTFHCGTNKWIELSADGKLNGGYGTGANKTFYGFIDFSADVWDTSMSQSLKGVQIQGDILRISTYRIAAAQSTNTGDTTYNGGNGWMQVVNSITDNGDGTISWSWTWYKFVNGLMCTELSD